ncbi:hypothetical protein VTO42DRAFT_5442 [Malbranchea cinnamomea]
MNAVLERYLVSAWYPSSRSYPYTCCTALYGRTTTRSSGQRSQGALCCSLVQDCVESSIEEYPEGTVTCNITHPVSDQRRGGGCLTGLHLRTLAAQSVAQLHVPHPHTHTHTLYSLPPPPSRRASSCHLSCSLTLYLLLFESPRGSASLIDSSIALCL